MKKFFIFGMIGAMALSFNACTSDDEVANEKIDQKEVKTRFALSLTNSVKTRMDANLAQVDEQFRGMSGIQVFAFNDDVTANSTIANNPIALADFTEFYAANVNAQVYTDVTIPVGTSDFLFYGKIADNGGEGELIASYDKETLQLGASVADAINFDLVPIVEDIDFSGGDDIVAGLNAVYAAIPEDPSWDELRAAFQSLKAGSWCSVAAFMEDMYQAVVAGDPNETAITGAIVDAGFVTDNGYAVEKADGFPRDLGLPDGAVQVAFADGEFAYTYPSVDGMDVPAMTAYTHPAELYYTVTKGVIDEETTHAPNFNNYEVWNDVITTEYAENVAPVTLTTKSVVLLDQVQYAVGRLDATVKVSDATVKDSGAEGGVANYVAVPADGYPVTGILIGGQKQVTWDFTPVEDADEFTIYDANVEGAAVVGTASEPMYTLALETASDQVVNIAVEFENTGDDFYGINHQVIPAGTKFYLVAQLDPTKAKNYASGELDKVFFQDHATKLDLTIGELSLQNAYNVVPDLRSPKLEFGLSVNLEWLEGLIFEHTF